MEYRSMDQAQLTAEYEAVSRRFEELKGKGLKILIPLMADAASQGDDLRLEYVDEIGQPTAQIVQILRHHVLGGGIPLPLRLKGGASVHPAQVRKTTCHGSR